MIIKNFLFHRVSPESDILWPPLSPELFDKIIQYIVKHHQVVSLEDIVLRKKTVDTNCKYATILFDDGYKDNIEYAVPILKRYNCPASFYLVTDCIDNNIPTWTHILEGKIEKTGKTGLKIDKNLLPEKLHKTIWKNESEKFAYGLILKDFLKYETTNTMRIQLLDLIFSSLDDVKMPENMMMNWDDIRHLKSQGYTIGSHTKTHPLLETINNKSDIKEELDYSGRRIKEETGDFPEAISYPNGSNNENVIEAAQLCGYSLGLAVKQRFYQSDKDDLFQIPRLEIYQESWFKTRLRINGIISRIKNGIGKEEH